MLAGRRVVRGDSVTDTLAKVIEREPDWTGALPGRLHPRVRGVLERCLRQGPVAAAARHRRRATCNSKKAPALLAAAVPLAARRPVAAAGMCARGRRGLVAVIAVGWLSRTPPATTDARETQSNWTCSSHRASSCSRSRARSWHIAGRLEVRYVAGGAGSRQVFVRLLDHRIAAARGTDAAFSTPSRPTASRWSSFTRPHAQRLSLRDGLLADRDRIGHERASLGRGLHHLGRDGLGGLLRPEVVPSRLPASTPRAGKWRTRPATPCLPASCSSPIGRRGPLLANNEGDTSNRGRQSRRRRRGSW